MPSAQTVNTPVATRDWRAHLQLCFAPRAGRTALVDSLHKGPLRVQKVFYPESDGTGHLYILHPPGGMVAGDQLHIEAHATTQSRVLITTPSAGRVYGTKTLLESQRQHVHLRVDDTAVLEYLPQETIIYNEARAHLRTRIDLAATGKAFVWDIVRLGRVQSGECFERGYCEQGLELWRAGVPLLMERNRFSAGSALQYAAWGLRACTVSATLCATVQLSKDQLQLLEETLTQTFGADSLWGLTQKGEVFIARYLGHSVAQCRAGLQALWSTCRPWMLHKNAVPPRIWNT